MADVTVTGGSANVSPALNYSSQGTAYVNALALAQMIDRDFGNTAAAYYGDPNAPQSAYLIVADPMATGAIVNAAGFSAISVQNNSGPTTVLGGGSQPQTIVAADGGLNFQSGAGNTTVVAGGGNNNIRLGAGTSEAITGDGNDTIMGGTGYASIDAGLGRNTIYTGAGGATIHVEGNDTIHAGSGLATVIMSATGTAVVWGSAGGSLKFTGGNSSSTVYGGAGRVTVSGGAGGGYFQGGTLGNNNIEGGSGAATLVGGGNGDTLTGGSANDELIAGKGNETLNAGGGSDVFAFTPGTDGGSGSVVTIYNFSIARNDLLQAGTGAGNDSAAINYALDHQSIAVGGDTITLQDGTKVVLVGVNVELGLHDIT